MISDLFPWLNQRVGFLSINPSWLKQLSTGTLVQSRLMELDSRKVCLCLCVCYRIQALLYYVLSGPLLAYINTN